MFAAHDAPQPPPTSPTRHGNGSHQDASTHRMKSSSQRRKMVMPPIMRLDSTGEVTSYESPVQSSGPARANSRRQGSAMHGLFGKLLSNSSPSSSKQLTVPRVMTGVSALDELCNSKQALERVTMAGLRPHWKSAKMAHSNHPRFDRYGQWCVANPTYPLLPQGIFPCHVFDALQSQQQQHHPIFASHSSLYVPKCVPSMPESLMETVRKFSAQSKQPSHHPQERQSAESPATGARVEAPSSNHSDVSPCVFEKSCTTCAADDVLVHVGSNTNSMPSVSDITPAASEAKSSVCETLLNDVGSSSIQDGFNCQKSVSISNENSSMQGLQKDNCVVNGYLTLCKKDVGKSQIEATPYACDSQLVHNCLHETATSAHKKPGICLNCERDGTSENASKMCDCELKVKDNVREQERTGTWCLQLLTQEKNSTGGTEMGKEPSHLGSGRVFVTMFQVQPVDEEGDEAWDDYETDDDSDELDSMSQAEAVGIFMLGGLTVNSILSTPCKRRQPEGEEEEEKEEGEHKSPPKPCPAATRRWNKLYPSDPPQHRPCTVRFTCGKEVDTVHLYELGEGEALTMMEIQKARDLSRQNKGKAAKLLQRKDFREDSPESQSPRQLVDSVCNLAAEADADCSDTCDGAASSPAQCSPSEASPVGDGVLKDRTVGCEEQDTAACAMGVARSPHSVSDEFDAGDLKLDSLRGGSESSECSDEEGSESEDNDESGDDDDDDDDDDIVFE